MKLKYKNGERFVYILTIRYHYLAGNDRHWIEFDDSARFQNFMEECHPGISCNKVRELFAKKYDELVALTDDESYDSSKCTTIVHCCLCGEELFVTTYEAGIAEKIYAYKDVSDKVNEGYIKTVLAHSWNFGMNDGIMRVRYWYDPEDNIARVYKIHIFKDKVILTRDGIKPASVIRIDNFYVHYEGEKKPE